MPNSNKKPFNTIRENADFIANLMTIGSHTISIATFSFAAIAGITLASQEQFIYIPIVNIPLGKEYQVALWVGGLLVYLELLARGWKDLLKLHDRSLSFPDFIIYELLFLKRPLLLLPLPFILAWGYNVFKQDSSAKSIFSAVLVISAIATAYILFERGIIDPKVERESAEFKYLFQRERSKWYSRIDKSLERQGFASTDKLLDENGLNGDDRHGSLLVEHSLIVNKALEHYHEEHESEQDLMLTKTEGKEFDTLMISKREFL